MDSSSSTPAEVHPSPPPPPADPSLPFSLLAFQQCVCLKRNQLNWNLSESGLCWKNTGTAQCLHCPESLAASVPSLLTHFCLFFIHLQHLFTFILFICFNVAIKKEKQNTCGLVMTLCWRTRWPATPRPVHCPYFLFIALVFSLLRRGAPSARGGDP